MQDQSPPLDLAGIAGTVTATMSNDLTRCILNEPRKENWCTYRMSVETSDPCRQLEERWMSEIPRRKIKDEVVVDC